jgi:monofunctional biosynthetic peptidoglycan transglycosylase
LALEVRLDQIDIAEMGRGSPPYGLTRLVSADLRLARTADGRWRSTVRSVAARGVQGVEADMTGLSWEGLNRKGGGVRTRKLRVAAGEVRVRGVAGARERFSLRGDEVAPDLLEIRIVSPPGRAAATQPVNARARGLSVYAVVDGVKRQARAEAGGLIALGHFNRFTRPAGVDLTAARIRGLFKATATEREVSLTTDATLTQVRIQRRVLAPHPVWWPRLGLRVKVRYQPRQRRLVLDRGDLTLADVPVQLSGTVTLADRSLRLRLRAILAPTSCAKLFAAVPPQLVPKLRGIVLGGRMGARLDVSLDSRVLKDLKLDFQVKPQRCRVIRDPPAAQVAALRRPFTFVTRPPGWKPTRLVMGPQNPNWRSFNRLGRSVKAAFLAAEDRRFFQHRGFDLENIRRALADNLRRRTLLKGASSISQQVVKNVFLNHRRNLSRKLQEVILTWRMEQVLTKQRILEIYLNLVEMGPGIFGVRAAAKHYFQREPSHLNPLEAAHLAAVTPSPRRYFARFRKGRAGMDWLLHLRWLMYQMLRIGWIDRAAYEKYRKQDLRLISY